MGKKDSAREQVIEQLASLVQETSRLKFLARHRSLLSPSTVERLDEMVSEWVRKDLKKAQALAVVALTVANKLGDKESQAHAFRAQANALSFLSQNREAAELHAQAVELFENAGKPTEVARTLSTSISPLILLGEYDRAHAAAERARVIFQEAGNAVRLARLDVNVGNIFHRQDRFQEALACYERAYQRLAAEKDVEGVVAALHNVGMCLVALNDHERALGTYEQVRIICRQRDMPLAAAQADYNIAYLYYSRGEYGRAIEILRTADEASQAAGDPYQAALCQLDLSEIYVELNMGGEAVELAQEAFRRFQQLGMGYEAAKALCNQAIALSQQAKGFQALELFAKSRAMFVQEKNLPWPSLIDLYQALAYLHEGRFFEARRYCLAALEFFRSSPLSGRAILCHLLLARLSLKRRDIDAARQDCQAALGALTGREAPILVYQANLVMGQIEEAARNLEAAKRHYEAAKEVLETRRGRLHGEELKVSFVKNRLEVYENLVNLSLAQGANRAAWQEAWTYVEQAKSRSPLDWLRRPVSPFVDEERGKSDLVCRIRNLREQLNWYYHRIEAEQLGEKPAPDERLLQLRELAEQREKELLRVLREVPAAEAEGSGIDSTGPVSLEALRSILGLQATLLEYFRVGDRILAILVTEDGLEVVPLTLLPRVAHQLRLLRSQFSKFQLGPSYVREFHEPLLQATQVHLSELYGELVAPIRRKLKKQHLIVVPHESLHYVPFHALYDGSQYLVDVHTISYAPSARVYAQCCQKQANASGPSLILGVPDPQTPSIYEELQSVAMILPTAELYLGPNATQKILKEKGLQSRLIHIATHGFFRQDNPMFSGIRLGDASLTLYDLYNLKLPADQIVLSGCSAGLNVVAAGDELIGLVRGLLFAGARTLLLTLWDVNDSSTAQFMKEFYTRLYARPDRAVALREAMAELRKHYPHPYYWAPFILVGKVFPSLG